MIRARYYNCISDYSGAYKANRRIKPRGIVIHSTGAENPNLKRWVFAPDIVGENPNNNYFSGKNDTREVMPHAVFGYNDKKEEYAICHILPYDYRCWGCGSGSKGSYNDSHIQIEIAEDYGLPRDYLMTALEAVAEWAAHLCIDYGIAATSIVSHKEAAAAGYASNHGDPEHWLNKYGLKMDDFREMVSMWIIRIGDTSGDAIKPLCELYDNVEYTETDSRKPTDDKPLDVLYTVQVGAFSKYDNAKEYAAKLKAMGIECFVKKR